MFETIQTALQTYEGSWKEKKGVLEAEFIISERKAFISTKKLTYSFRVKVDDAKKIVNFSEMLKEASSGVSSGSDDGISAGFGFKTESYNTMNGSRQGTIEEQSDLFEKKFDYKFDYKELRSVVQNTAEYAGYEFKYQILPVK